MEYLIAFHHCGDDDDKLCLDHQSLPAERITAQTQPA
jgi:hypothetical protein